MAKPSPDEPPSQDLIKLSVPTDLYAGISGAGFPEHILHVRMDREQTFLGKLARQATKADEAGRHEEAMCILKKSRELSERFRLEALDYMNRLKSG